ncbi:MAG TPA: hypothetical protein VIP70_08375 [Nitrososphaeraceae archaeon]
MIALRPSYSAGNFKRRTNLIVSTALISTIFISAFIVQTAFAQNLTNIPTSQQNESTQSIQLTDFKTLAGEGLLTPVLLVPIDAVGENVYFAWSTNKTHNFDVFFTRSTDGGKTLQDAFNLSNSSETESTDVSLKAEGKNVYVSWWENYQNGTNKPAIRVSNDNGESFGEKVFLGTLIKE